MRRVSKQMNSRVQSQHSYFTFSLTSQMHHYGRKLVAIHAVNVAPNVAVPAVLSYSYLHWNTKIPHTNSCQCKHTTLLGSRLQIKAGNVKLHAVAT